MLLKTKLTRAHLLKLICINSAFLRALHHSNQMICICVECSQKGNRCKRKMCLHGARVWLMSSALKGQFTKNDNGVTHLVTNAGIHKRRSWWEDRKNQFIKERWDFSVNSARRPGDIKTSEKKRNVMWGENDLPQGRKTKKNQSMTELPGNPLCQYR